MLDIIADASNIITAFCRVRSASGWKPSTQQWELNLLTNVAHLKRELPSGDYRQHRGYTFVLNEQGHIRLIKALEVRDMVMQHSLCENVLIPRLTTKIIHDSGASIKGKGLSFTRRRFEQHLRSFYREHGRDGYILKIDFRKYFDNIEHDKLLAAIEEAIPDARLAAFLTKLMKSYEVDISDMPDFNPQTDIYNSLAHFNAKGKKTGDRMMRKSVGIGSPISQIAGIYFPTPIDTWVKTVRRLKYYDVYMDDRVIIHHDKEHLKQLLGEIRAIAKRLGLHTNERKTQLIKLTHGFTFLKTRYILTDTGRIVRKIPRDVVTRHRRRLKTLARLAAAGTIPIATFDRQHRAWCGDKRRYNAYHALSNENQLYRRLRQWITKNRPSSTKSGRKSASCAASSPATSRLSATIKSSRPTKPVYSARLTRTTPTRSSRSARPSATRLISLSRR